MLKANNDGLQSFVAPKRPLVNDEHTGPGQYFEGQHTLTKLSVPGGGSPSLQSLTTSERMPGNVRIQRGYIGSIVHTDQ